MKNAFVYGKKVRKRKRMTRDRQKEEVNHYISNLPDDIQQLTQSLRTLILETDSNLEEEYKWSMPNYSYKGLVCYLQASKQHVNLGFHKGNELKKDDIAHLLQGSGKTMRHIRVKQMEDIQTQAFQDLIIQAISLNQ